MTDELVTVAQTSSEFEAEAIAARLGAVGIDVSVVGPSRVDDALPGSMVAPTSVRVAAEDAETARAILAEPATLASDDVDVTPSRPRSMPVPARIALVVAIVLMVVTLVGSVYMLIA